MAHIKLKRTHLYLTKRQHDAVKKIANKRGITFSEIFRTIVDEYLERKDVKK